MSPAHIAAAWSGFSSPWPEQEHLAAPDFTSIHAVNATTAAFHADVAAKHAASLAQWVQYLQFSLGQLQNKVTELENWKKTALDDIRKLRDENKLLKRKVIDEKSEEAKLPPKSKSSPLMPGASTSVLPPVDEDHPAPPGLTFADTDAPGADQAQVDSSPSQDDAASLPHNSFSMASLASDVSLSDIDGGQLEGVTVAPGEINGMECVKAEWRIGHLSTKLRGCMGRALVSSPFMAAGLEDLRLMICPDGKEATKGPRSRRQKELYAKKVMEGPLEGCLKLKAPTSSDVAQEIDYYLKVGSKRMGPFTHNFAESTVSGCDDFGVDWLKQLEPDFSLTVCIEIISPSGSKAKVSSS